MDISIEFKDPDDKTSDDTPDIEQGVGGEDQEKSKSKTGALMEEFVPTDLNKGLNDEQVQASREKFGTNEIPVPETPLYMIFLRQFVGFLPLLIELAALVSLGVQDYVDFLIITSILTVNATLGFREEYHAKKSLDDLSNSLESEITVVRNGKTENILTKHLVPGDIILLVGGTVVPADVQWIKGDKMQIDTAPLTGEPIPRKYPSDEYGYIILSGTTVVAGECFAQVLRTGTDTEIGQAQASVLKDKSVRVVSVFQRKIMKVVQILVSASFAVVLAVLLAEGLGYKGFSVDAKKSVLTALSILIASIPVALPLVLQVNLALGASFLAKEHHAIVTSIPALQDIASMSMLCSDKTGTLTTANMSVIPEQIFAYEGFTKEDVILYAYLCSNLHKKDDPIDRAIINAFSESQYKESSDEYNQLEMIGFNPTVKRVVAFVQHGKETLTIAKGLPAKIINTAAGSIDDHELQWKVEHFDDAQFVKDIEENDSMLSKNGYKTLGIAICKGNAREQKDAVWQFVGLLPMLDPPRKDTRATIESLHHANISVKMITGDHVNVGKETARMIGLGTDIQAGSVVRNATGADKKDLVWNADGFASVLPSDKREVVQILRNDFGLVVGMTGDGVNDAPALSAAQVGIAVADATDAARKAADLILTEPGLSPIYGAVLESRRIFARIKAYIVYRVAATVILVLTLSTVIFVSGCAVDPLLVIILALINDISMIPVAYDNAKATTKPQLPHSKKLVYQSLFYGICHSVAALGFIFVMDNLSLANPIELGNQCPAETRGLIWFYMAIVTEAMIFSVRAPSFLALSSPSIYLIASVFLACIASAFVAVYASHLSWANAGWVLLWNAVVFVLVDALKIPFLKLIDDAPGDVIESDDLIQAPVVETTEKERIKQKEQRYQVHEACLLEPQDREQHIVEIRPRKQVSGLSGFFSELRPISITDGYLDSSIRNQTILFRSRESGGRQKQLSSPF